MSWEIFQIGKHVEVLGRGHTWRGCGSSEPPTFPIPCLICISLIWLSLYNKPVIVFQSFSHVLLFWDSMDCSTPGFPVLHHLQELAQTHVHWVSDAIQPSHLLSSPSPPAFSPSQHQSFLMSQPFTSGGQSIVVSASASVLAMSIQDWFPLGLTGWISLQSKSPWRLLADSRVFSNTTVQKHQFFGTQPFLWSNSPIHTWLLDRTLLAK